MSKLIQQRIRHESVLSTKEKNFLRDLTETSPNYLTSQIRAHVNNIYGIDVDQLICDGWLEKVQDTWYCLAEDNPHPYRYIPHE